MNPDYADALVWGLVLAAIVGGLAAAMSGKGGGSRGGPGPGASGAVYDLLNQDKRNAIELIVEEKAGYRDPEDADGTPKAGKDECRMPNLLIWAFVI